MLFNPGAALWLLANNVARLGRRQQRDAIRVGAVFTALGLAAVITAVRLPFIVSFMAGAAIAVVPVLFWRDRLYEQFRQGASKAPLLRAVVTVAVFGVLGLLVGRTLAALGFKR